MRHRQSWRVLAVLAVLALAGQLYGLYRVTGPPTPAWFPQADKLEHASGFALPAGLVLAALDAHARALGAAWRSQRRVALVAGAFAAHAVVSELVQHAFYAARSGDPLDVLADWTGTAVGVAAALVLRRYVVDLVDLR